MIKIEFPANRADIALALGAALTTIGGGAVCRAVGMAPELAAGYGGQTEGGHLADDYTDRPETAETVTGPATSTEPAPVATAVQDAEVDTKGVAKDPAFCANAKDPFYATGKRAGQWKKRQGVADDAYDIWYEDQLEAVSGGLRDDAAADEEAAPPVDAAAAFAPSTQQAAPVDPDVPKDCGTFMGWVAKMQASGAVSQEQVGAAYSTAGLEVADLFGPDAAAVAQNVATLYGILSAQVAR